jgi:two-component system sensor histidine kinase KdpD
MIGGRKRVQDDLRPTGEQMLARIQGESRPARGRLRVYLGMAPGVGKTYKMLEEAHRRLERGTDVVVGFAECHGRERTMELLDGLEVVPRMRIEYRGVIVEEMDTEAILARRPTVAMVDELAHTNAPGSPREKRWQDVQVLLDAGIEVISTCNVQHVESVADAVQTITGAPVNERLPDAVLQLADEVELVDMSPRALRQRMKHGNVYPADRAQVALDRFFTEPNLTALRELALRFVTQQVDDQLEDIVASHGFGGLPSVSERVLVSVDERPISRRAVRGAAAYASALRAPLAAVVIETPDIERLAFDRQRDLRENLEFAADLGAEILRFQAPDVASGLEHVARSRRITDLFVGHQARGGMDRWLRPSPVDRLVDGLPDLQIHVVGPGTDPGEAFDPGGG